MPTTDSNKRKKAAVSHSVSFHREVQFLLSHRFRMKLVEFFLCKLTLRSLSFQSFAWLRTLLDYMKQDILLLGGVMQKAQDIYWKLFQVDIESKITLSSLALTIFRLKYYDEKNWPIHIPNKNEDSFIRRAYYGGHTDVYMPYGENLYYYDVNSLYPFGLKEFPY